ncbi:MAG: hypothetical protein WAM97_21280 [Acidimicrobiales bacterium]
MTHATHSAESAYAAAPRMGSIRRWCRAGVLSILAATIGALGLSSAAFATTSSSGLSAASVPATATTLLTPEVVYTSNRGANIVELLPTGAVVILQRTVSTLTTVTPATPTAPATTTTSVTVKKTVTIEPAPSSTTTTASFTATHTKQVTFVARPRVFVARRYWIRGRHVAAYYRGYNDPARSGNPCQH